jgi:hypothetical protein
MDEHSEGGGEFRPRLKQKSATLFRTGFTPPWDCLQVISWLLYSVVSGYVLWAILNNRINFSTNVLLIVFKCFLSLCSVMLVIWVTCKDPTDELFYKNLDPYKA